MPASRAPTTSATSAPSLTPCRCSFAMARQPSGCRLIILSVIGAGAPRACRCWWRNSARACARIFPRRRRSASRSVSPIRSRSRAGASMNSWISWSRQAEREPKGMKILVGIKRVVDYNVRVRVKPDGSGVALDGVKMSINPFDEIALEEALRIRERNQATEVIVVAVGPEDVQTQLRSALAMGADRAILVKCDQTIEPQGVARALLAIIRQEQVGLAILGKQAIDDDAGQTGQMLAALWERPQVTFAS